MRATPQGRVHQLTVPAKIRQFGREIERQSRAVRCANTLSQQHTGTLRGVNVIEGPGQKPTRMLWCERCIEEKVAEQMRRARGALAAHGVRGVRG